MGGLVCYAVAMLWGFFEEHPISIVGLHTQVARPRWLNVGKPHPYIANHRKIEWFESFIHACEAKKVRSVCFIRTFALGDILMLLPIVRAMGRALDLDRPPIIVVRREYYRQLKNWTTAHQDFHLRVANVNTTDYDCDLHIDLEKCLESDHWGGEDSNHHRCVLYGKALGLEVCRGEL